MVIAEIIYAIDKNGTGVRRFKYNDYDSIYNCLMEITNENHETSSNAASWCELAIIGEEYDTEKFNIEIIEIDGNDKEFY